MVKHANPTRQPFLPVELEMTIVKLLAQEISFPVTRKGCYLNLQLTAKRFREWYVAFTASASCRLIVGRVATHLYRVVFSNPIGSRPYPWASTAQAIKSFGRYTTHLCVCLSGGINEFTRTIEQCPNLENIEVWYSGVIQFDRFLITTSSLSKLKRLSLDRRLNPRQSELALRSPLFQNLTHLNILQDPAVWRVLPLCKSLTHLCIGTPEQDWLAHVHHITDKVHGCRSLRVLVALSQDTFGQVNYRDPRFILLDIDRPLNDWLNGANGDMDMWEFAELIVFARKNNYVNNPDSNRAVKKRTFDYRAFFNAAGQEWWLERYEERLANSKASVKSYA
ncbi:hypothetical protein CVT24_009734 [Panaeolus cyanescens]|uniref:F-box domain-containing protein n=1 Tax=Panaeolus cyanescens TaxID=181874 RepID=A0A409Y9Y0_9AGAR|nr:hypothetical protein CVT24_009734 [Panaeolus cyanescens]